MTRKKKQKTKKKIFVSLFMVMRQKTKGKENVNPQSGAPTKTLPRVRDINRDDYKLVQLMN